MIFGHRCHRNEFGDGGALQIVSVKLKTDRLTEKCHFSYLETAWGLTSPASGPPSVDIGSLSAPFLDSEDF